MNIYIAVIGGSVCTEEEKKIAYAVGSEIVERGGIVICGGGSGVMEAAARGASEAGGTAIGVLPGNDHRAGNRYLKHAIATGLGEARNAIIARTADAVIAIGGEFGTLSEIALALKMDKPVIGLQSWSIKPPLALKQGIVATRCPRDAVNKAFSILQKN